MKRVLVMVLAMLTLLGAARAVTPATPVHFCGEYVYILLDDGGAEIVCWDGEETDLAVPETLDEHPVVSVSECAFADCRTLRTVTLPESVRAIGDEAFAGCTRLSRVTLPQGLETLGGMAFDHCEGLTQIALPATLREMGTNPFVDCANLCAIDVPAACAAFYTVDGVLFSRGDQRLVCYPMGLWTDSYAVPEGTVTIGARAFEQGIFLERVDLPASMATIEDGAFNGCAALSLP